MYDNQLVCDVFGSLCIEKARINSCDITKQGIPSFVAEWLLDKIVPGTGELTIAEVEKLNNFIQSAFPRKEDKNVIHFQLSEGETKVVIALMQARVKMEKAGQLAAEPLAKIDALGFTEPSLNIPVDIVRKHEMLLRHGVWGKVTLAKIDSEQVEVIGFDPFQCSSVNFKLYEQYRSQFTTTQWKDLMVCSMGINPEHPNYNDEAKTWVLARLLPLVMPNFHVIELAPKGTGKSFFFENVSSKVIVIGGGKVTPSQLFINGKTKEVGLLGRYSTVIFDEVQSLTFDNPDEIIGTFKGYLANGRYNRSGYADIASDCSTVMLANIELDRDLRPRNEHYLVGDLPQLFSETALLDRFAGIIPGWEIPKFQASMKARQFALKADFFGEVLFAMRRDARYSTYAQQHSHISIGTSGDCEAGIRDNDAILQSAAGFLKILYPHLQLTPEDFYRDCLQPAARLRQYVRNSLCYLDEEYRNQPPELIVELR
jgi:ATP-dependent Lon protease